MKKARDFILVITVCLSIPFLIKWHYMKDGSIYTSAEIVEIVRCAKGNRCFKYTYEIGNKVYDGEISFVTNLEIGSKIRIKVSKKDPSVSYHKK